MFALVSSTLGAIESARIEQLPVPQPGPREVRVRVHASAFNPADAKTILGQTSLVHAKGFPLVMGYDLSGEVDALGPDVKDLQVGQAVFGFHAYSRRTRLGAFAEYAVLPAAFLVPKPAAISHATAAAAATVGLTALQALRDRARFRAGHRALVTGASGGVGALAIGIAKCLGGEADALTSSRHLDFVSGLDAVRVFDRAADFRAALHGPYEVVFDAAAAYSLRTFRHVLARHGTYVTTLPSPRFVADLMAAPFLRRRARMVMVKPRRGDLEMLGRFLEEGLPVPIDREVRLSDAAAALAHFARVGARGKVVVEIASR
jgi:NADPH:quinone reductase-like Zn-dependent oxidoreductase